MSRCCPRIGLGGDANALAQSANRVASGGKDFWGSLSPGVQVFAVIAGGLILIRVIRGVL